MQYPNIQNLPISYIPSLSVTCGFPLIQGKKSRQSIVVDRASG
jgi:hypothetical protein